MKLAMWLLALAAIGLLGYAIWNWRRRWQERERASEERLAALMAEAKPRKPEAAPSTLAQQKLLFEAAAKAGEAGEPALSVELYARFLARFPDSGFAEQARGALEAQKQKLAKA